MNTFSGSTAERPNRGACCSCVWWNKRYRCRRYGIAPCTENPHKMADGVKCIALKYNCVALAACDDLTVWWVPSTMNSRPVIRPGRYWPLELPTDDYISTYCKLFESLGYRQCANARLE